MAANAANAAPAENDESDSNAAPTNITPDLLAQVPSDPNHALNTFLNDPNGPFSGLGPRESLEKKIQRLEAQKRDTRRD